MRTTPDLQKSGAAAASITPLQSSRVVDVGQAFNSYEATIPNGYTRDDVLRGENWRAAASGFNVATEFVGGPTSGSGMAKSLLSRPTFRRDGWRCGKFQTSRWRRRRCPKPRRRN